MVLYKVGLGSLQGRARFVSGSCTFFLLPGSGSVWFLAKPGSWFGEFLRVRILSHL